MGVEEHKAVIRGIYESAAARDLQKFLSLVQPDIEVNQPAWLPYGGSYTGVDRMLHMMGGVLKLFDLGAIDVTTMVGEGDDVWATFRVPLRDGPAVMIAEHWRMRDGKAAWLEVWHLDPRPVMERTG